jgi:ribosomal protein L37AE/L43A
MNKAVIVRGVNEPCPECGRRMCTRSATGIRQPCSNIKPVPPLQSAVEETHGKK